MKIAYLDCFSGISGDMLLGALLDAGLPAAELTAVLSFAATNNNDKVGLMIFTDQVELLIPPRKGRKHVLRMIRELLAFEPQGTHVGLVDAEYQVAQGRLSSPVLPDYGQNATGANLNRHVSQGLGPTERLADVPSFQHNLLVLRRPGSRSLCHLSLQTRDK